MIDEERVEIAIEALEAICLEVGTSTLAHKLAREALAKIKGVAT